MFTVLGTFKFENPSKTMCLELIGFAAAIFFGKEIFVIIDEFYGVNKTNVVHRIWCFG